MTVRIIRGDARNLPLPDGSVDLVVTSPPYFGLRSYQDAGEHYGGQVGAEATPAEFASALLECTREMMRVVKPSGSIWVNLGDKYAGSVSGGTQNGNIGVGGNKRSGRTLEPGLGRVVTDVRAKSLIGIPWRYALACIDELGLILRAEVIWSKPNGLPESVTDRVRRSHEQWFHFTREPRYYSAVDEIRDEYAAAVDNRSPGVRVNRGETRSGPQRSIMAPKDRSLGKLPGSVWSIPTQPLTVPAHLGVDHFAAFPMEAHQSESQEHEVPTIDDTRLRGGLEPVAPNVTEVGLSHGAQASNGRPSEQDVDFQRGRSPHQRSEDGQSDRESRTAGQDRARPVAEAAAASVRLPPLRRTDSDVRNSQPCPNCGGASFRPSVVADVFGGTGTTALVADALGRHGISVDMSQDYCRLAGWRTTDPTEMAQARGKRLAPELRPTTGQVDMFDGAA